MIYVTNRNNANKLIKEVGASALISFGDFNGKRTFQCRLPDRNHLQLYFDDLIATSAIGPQKHHVETFLEFADKFADNVIVVNCEAGISRSTAAALSILYMRSGDIEDAKAKLLAVRPKAAPNPIITRLADQVLDSGTTIYDAGEEITDNHLFSNLMRNKTL